VRLSRPAFNWSITLRSLSLSGFNDIAVLKEPGAT
jgi:hypothetical protein